MTVHDRLAYLVQKAASQSATPEELQELANLVRNDPEGGLSEQIAALLDAPGAALPPQEHWEQLADGILAADHPPAPPIIPMRRPWRRWSWAAAVALLLAAGAAYWLFPRKPAAPPALVQKQPQDIQPGGNRAVLTLADGTQISLDSAGKGALARQGNTRVIKSANGSLVYQPGSGQSQANLFNRIATPRGGQYQVTLPDGSKVWLNAASSLRYPAAFGEGARKVQLSGEGYFEIAADAQHPFIVQVEDMEVEVLGTQFNIMAYDDETAMKTTLLEGAVKVKSRGGSKKLLPGQGASLDRHSGVMKVQHDVNTEEATAWKNGFIQFEGSDIYAVMRQLSRWYDVEVVYKGNVPAHFRGIVPRNVPVSQVLEMLEQTGEAHFEVSGRKIIVSP